MLPGHQGGVGFTPARTEFVALSQGEDHVADRGWMHAQHLAVIAASKGVGAQHGHGLDREFAQRDDPIIEDAVEGHVVKINRASHLFYYT